MQKNALLFSLCLTLALPGFHYPYLQAKHKLKSIEWILGTWQRTNAKPGQMAYEKWEKVSEEEFNGIGVTLKGKDTVFVEKLKITMKGGKLLYVAEVSHNQGPVYFKLIKCDKSGFVSSNPDHDFPKEISYRIESDKLKVVISGNGKSMVFDFTKVE